MACSAIAAKPAGDPEQVLLHAARRRQPDPARRGLPTSRAGRGHDVAICDDSALTSPRGVRPLAVELDANQQVALRNRRIETYGSLADLPRPMDFIYSSNVLEHIPDDVAALAALWDSLVVGGKIAIFVPAFESIWTTLDDHVGHQRRYTIASLREKLVATGFEVEAIKYCDSLGFLLAFLYKFIGDASGEPSGTSLKLFDRVVFPVSLVVDGVTSRLFGKNVLALARRI